MLVLTEAVLAFQVPTVNTELSDDFSIDFDFEDVFDVEDQARTSRAVPSPSQTQATSAMIARQLR